MKTILLPALTTAPLLWLGIVSAIATAAADDLYRLYEPEIVHRTIYEASIPDEFGGEDRRQSAPQEGDPMPYNHCAALAHFDGKFHCIWQGTQWDLRENQEGQRLWLSTSEDFETWSAPQPFVALGPTAVAGRGVQKQPGLLRYSDDELWAIWHHHGGEDAGVYFSRLRKGESTWENRRLWNGFERGGRTFVVYPTQDPWRFGNGRVAAPCVFIEQGAGKSVRFAGAIYTDDGGESWEVSNFFRSPETSGETWEPFLFEQADGTVRVYARSPFFETLTGTGAREGEALRFDGFTQRSWMEGVSERPWVTRLPGGRFLLLRHDAYASNSGLGGVRRNLALAFSRTGDDDFVFGPPVSYEEESRWNYWSSAYPQGCVVGDTLYIASSDSAARGPHHAPRSIRGIAVSPLPAPGQRYLWPRARQFYRTERYRDGNGKLHHFSQDRWASYPRAEVPRRAEHAGREAIRFGDGSAAGVEQRDDALADGRLVIECELFVEQVQMHGFGDYPEVARGKLTLLTVGDLNPLRLAYQPNAGDRLWFFDGSQWHRQNGFAPGSWHRIRLSMDDSGASLSIDAAAPRTYPGARLPRNPVLYFGEGIIEKRYEGDVPRLPLNNRGSVWHLDPASLRVR